VRPIPITAVYRQAIAVPVWFGDDRSWLRAKLSGGRRASLTVPYPLRRWEMLAESTPNVGENDTSLSLKLFQARRG
jgi:mediator of RNA polymerase II transcription subunit 12